MNDPEIIEGLRSRTPEAHLALYDGYADGLFDYCFSLLHDEVAASAATRDAFVTAGISADAMAGRHTLRAWLYTFARAECRQRGGRAMEHADIDDSRLTSALEYALRGLNAADREVLELSVRHWMAPGELGVVFGLPTDRVDAMIRDGREALTAALTDELLRDAGIVEYPRLAVTIDGTDPLRILLEAFPSVQPPERLRTEVTEALMLGAPLRNRRRRASAGDTTALTPAQALAAEPAPGRRRGLLLGAGAATCVVVIGVVVALGHMHHTATKSSQQGGGADGNSAVSPPGPPSASGHRHAAGGGNTSRGTRSPLAAGAASASPSSSGSHHHGSTGGHGHRHHRPTSHPTHRPTHRPTHKPTHRPTHPPPTHSPPPSSPPPSGNSPSTSATAPSAEPSVSPTAG